MKKTPFILLFCLFALFSRSQNVELDIKVFLEGPFSSYQMIPYLNVFGEIPLDQPFNTNPWNYNGTENVSDFPTFDIVDWILVDVIKRQGSGDIEAFELIQRRAGLLMKDGKVRDLDGSSNLSMDLEGLSLIYIRIQHRNHLSVISAVPIVEYAGEFKYDFSSGQNQSLGNQYTQKQLSPTIWGMMAADADANGHIDNKDKNEVWLLQYGSSGYYSGDFNLDSQVDESDKDYKWGSNLGHAAYVIKDTIAPLYRCGDSLLDARDGQKYATIQIGYQCWMKDNLNIGVFTNGVNDQSDNGIIEKHCYNNEVDSCDFYGGLYMWDEMMQYNTNPSIKGICPPDAGWRLPTDFEWKVMEGTADSQFPTGDPEWDNFDYRGYDAGGHLKDTTTRFWSAPNAGATNKTGFTALGGGFKYGQQDFYSLLGQSGIYWSSDLHTSNNPYSREFNNSMMQVNRLVVSKTRSHSVRCINTTKGINYPPYPPYDPLPEESSLDIDLDTTLVWSCSDPNGDDIIYNIYFGGETDPPLVATFYTDTVYNPGSLVIDSTYHWRIVAYDIKGDSTEGPVWSFTSRSWACEDVLVDERDDQHYNTTRIGEQCWMANNLNIGTRIDGVVEPTDNEIIEKYCYNDLEDSCSVYGGLYKWNEMMAYSSFEGTTGICPTGWYVPTDEEWKQLEGEADSQFDYPDPIWDMEGWRGYDVGYNLKAQSGWFVAGGSDLYSFTALPGGLWDYSTSTYQQVSLVTGYWSSTSNVSNWASIRYMAFSNSDMVRVFNDKNYGFSVRCVLDESPPNQPPAQPSNPMPEDGSTNIGLDTTLVWSCSDPEGTTLLYNVYFGGEADPPKVATFYADTAFNPGPLVIDSTYYWKIVAYDIKGDSTEGPVWSFTSRSWACDDVLIDERDDQHYNTTRIGEQCWMADNLNIGTRIDGVVDPTDNEIIEKYCYNDLEDSCAVYGGLYKWNEMMAYSSFEGTTGICPNGWYVPTDEEWKQLEGEADSQFDYPDPMWDMEGWRGYDVAYNLKSQSGWLAASGSDLVGFSSLPAGLWDFSTTTYQSVGQITSYWTSSSNLGNMAGMRYLAFTNADVLRVFNDKNYGFSVRCVLDESPPNQPPAQPSNPMPGDGSSNIGLDTTLVWSCSDPEGTTLIYNVYFGGEADPPKVATFYADTVFNPGLLVIDSTYYWKIVAYDIKGDSTEGPVWSFTSRSWTCEDVLVDERDDQHYNTIQIGEQCWMAENLNIGTRIDGIIEPTDNEIIEKYCYNNLEDSCAVYGGLYKWNEMMDYSILEGDTGICPTGWYIPTDEEWKQLEGKADTQFNYPDPMWDIEGWRGFDAGYNLKAQDGWYANLNGSDLYGFNSIPAGLFDFSTISYQSVGQVNSFWTSSTNVSNLASMRYIAFTNADILRVFNDKNYGLSVRCLKN